MKKNDSFEIELREMTALDCNEYVKRIQNREIYKEFDAKLPW